MYKSILLFALFSFQATAQPEVQVLLEFDKRFVECEDQWVAFQMDEDSTFTYGFIYIDSEAGLTLNSEGSFKFGADGTLENEKITGASIKVRLEPNDVHVAILPESMFEDLEIEKIPDWLKHYKTDENTAARQYKWGFMYNGWGECKRALPFLMKAKELDPGFKNVAVEIAFSYNCLKDYDKAIAVLETELKLNPTDAYVIKEYIYSVCKTDAIDKAVNQFNSSVKTIDDDIYCAENCFNIMQYYYSKGDKKNFKIWHKELKKWPNENKQIDVYSEKMKQALK
jgi:tetratricopeptide (TPR) repeat protein